MPEYGHGHRSRQDTDERASTEQPPSSRSQLSGKEQGSQYLRIARHDAEQRRAVSGEPAEYRELASARNTNPPFNMLVDAANWDPATREAARGYSKITKKMGLKTNCYIGVVLEGIFEAFLIKDTD